MPEISLTAIIQYVGYPGLFAIVFLESGVFFGFFLPGASMLFAAGLLASQGYFNIWILIPLLTLAAILGDNVGYWFGSKFGRRLFEWHDSRFFKKKHLEQARVFYERHGVLAVVLARFVPIVRTFAPIIAGVVGMRYRTFFMYNIMGALAWASGITFIAYYLGEKIPDIDKFFTPIIVLIIVTTCIPLVLEYLKQRKKAKSTSSV